MCRRTDEFRVAPKSQRLQIGLADQLLLSAHKCVLQNVSFQDCTQGSPRVTRVWRAAARTHIVKAHAPYRIDQINQGLHPRLKGYNCCCEHTHVSCSGVADQLLL